MPEVVRALPLALFPPVHWWVEALDTSTYIDTDRSYHKQTLRNRMSILTSNGRLHLTVPVQSTGGIPTPMREVRLADGKWRHEHLYAIRSAYGRAAYFEHYYPMIEACYKTAATHLSELCRMSLEIVLQQCAKKGVAIHTEKPLDAQVDEPLTRQLSLHLEPAYAGIAEPGYPQAFSDRFEFQHNLSCIDLLMNKGPQSIDYILFIKNATHPKG
jgi:hypothetical protein